MTAAIWWIRRDLRLHDNPALNAAIDHAEYVIPVFVMDPTLNRSPYTGEKRYNFLLQNLKSLDEQLRNRGSRLVVRNGEPVAELHRIREESDAKYVFAEPDYSPYALQRDKRAGKELPIQWIGSPAIIPPGTVLQGNGKPYTVFTPFSRTWKAQPFSHAIPHSSAPENIPTPAGVPSDPLPEPTHTKAGDIYLPGESEARRRLREFTSSKDAAVYQYAQARNRPDLEATSGLSPYLRFGIISPRWVAAAAYQALRNVEGETAKQSAETWLNELIWREFYIHLLFHFPWVRARNFQTRQINWENNQESFAAWCEGRTGYPIVDAAMRQLTTIGWMHNRTRMIVASFLTKDLLIDWRWGERFFMQHLIDGDPAANNGGWQWTAGTGADAAPYFRIFNPILQSKKFDPDGLFIRRWLPELTDVPTEFIHEPWKMPLSIQEKSACKIGKNYPGAMIDHDWARQRTLAAYGQAK